MRELILKFSFLLVTLAMAACLPLFFVVGCLHRGLKALGDKVEIELLIASAARRTAQARRARGGK